MNHFEKELELIKDEKVRTFTEKVLESVAPEFFQAAASSTGKYHPKYALGEGGLYRHTRAAVGIAASLLELDMYRDAFVSGTADYCIAALILHDTCKSGRCWDSKYTKHSHPIEAKQLVEEVLAEEVNSGDPDAERYVRYVGDLIASHMGQWNTARWDRTVLPKPISAGEKFVHLCDYLASRKFLEYQFEEVEENVGDN